MELSYIKEDMPELHARVVRSVPANMQQFPSKITFNALIFSCMGPNLYVNNNVSNYHV